MYAIRSYYVFQHQIPDVPFGDDDPLGAVETPDTAEREEPLDLLVHSADRLHVSPLIHRSRNGNALPYGDFRDRTEERVELCTSRAIPLDHTVQLLEGKRRCEADRPAHGVSYNFV